MNSRAFGATALTAVAVAVIFYYQSILNIVLGAMLFLILLFLVSWVLSIIYEGYRDYFEECDNRTKDNKCAEESP